MFLSVFELKLEPKKLNALKWWDKPKNSAISRSLTGHNFQIRDICMDF